MPELTLEPIELTKDSEGRLLVPVSKLLVDARLRVDLGDVEELAEDIRLNGLIQPVVIDRKLRLIAGGRRYTAMSKLLKWDHIPCVYKDVTSEVHHRVMEIAENTKRKDLDWKEWAVGIAEAHRLMAQEKILNFERWTRTETGELFGVSRASVNNACVLAERLLAKDPDILKCESARDALLVLVRRRENELTKKLSELTLPPKKDRTPSAPPLGKSGTAAGTDEIDLSEEGFTRTNKDFGQLEIAETLDETPGQALEEVPGEVIVPLSRMLFHVDCIDFGKNSEAGFCDHIITDIPYGIDMDNLVGQHSREDLIDAVRAEHDVESNKALYEEMLPVFYRALREKGFCIMFYDTDHHELLQSLAYRAGFSVQRWPCIWHKLHPCKNGAPGQNFTKDFESIMVLRKGTANLVAPQSKAVFQCGADREMRMFGHPFVKPMSLWHWLFKATCIQGQVVWDPFAGVGSGTISAIDFGLRPIACELVEEHYHKLVVNVSDKYNQNFRRTGQTGKFE